MKIAAHAKVNFTLEVLGVRPDGYHDLRSVVVPVSLADEVALEPADDVTLALRSLRSLKSLMSLKTLKTLKTLETLNAEDNLAVRAARLMQRVSGRRDGVAISLVKRIPVGGGLGGGSADAAAVLNGLNEMWKLGIPRNELAALGAEIGSDVPALVLGGAVLMEGRGERVDWLDGCETRGSRRKSIYLVLANPGVFCSTPEIFKAFKDHLPNRPEILYNIRLAMQSGDGAAVARALQNDLAATAMRLHPEIEMARRRLEEAGCLGASMSGSGATVFGIARDVADAGRIASELEAEGLWSVAVETVR
ncbi:MAG: 4-(cytidine 5'-diphospho)-2-C-methyl-D-erythritol kinase [Kiritimatiellae bacterium]|nr:4-(cytidine 5'-diphospho)-2-C-methyl-D-erythritol kinase [Kiritimatiellia bacterium]